ncbi:unnamed protein product [Amaranthus hypochondriacus]
MKRFNQKPFYSSSWEDYQEEEAFVKDAIGGSYGVGPWWPPRLYSCSYCKREFRSAQALGGHMNVHRRDRALLKQVIIPIPNHDNDHHDHGHNVMINPCNSMLSQNPSHLHQNHDHDHHVMSNPQNPSHICNPKASVAHHFDHTHNDDHDNHHVMINPSNSMINYQIPSKNYIPKGANVAHHLALSKLSSNCSISEVKKVISITNDVFDHTKMSMGLDLAIGTSPKEDDYQDHGCMKNKRFKQNGDTNVALIPFYEEIKSSNDIKDFGLEFFNPKACKSREELDLELRLGVPSHKVK